MADHAHAHSDSTDVSSAALTALVSSLNENLAKVSSLSENVAKMQDQLSSLSENVDKVTEGLKSVTETMDKQNVDENTVTSDKFRGAANTDTRFTEKDAHSTSTEHGTVKQVNSVEAVESISSINAQVVAYGLHRVRELDSYLDTRKRELDRHLDRMFGIDVGFDARIQHNALSHDARVQGLAERRYTEGVDLDKRSDAQDLRNVDLNEVAELSINDATAAAIADIIWAKLQSQVVAKA